MGPTFDAFAWLHGILFLALAITGLAAFVASGVAEYQDRKEQGRADRRRRLARLHDTADQVRRGELEA